MKYQNWDEEMKKTSNPLLPSEMGKTSLFHNGISIHFMAIFNEFSPDVQLVLRIYVQNESTNLAWKGCLRTNGNFQVFSY